MHIFFCAFIKVNIIILMTILILTMCFSTLAPLAQFCLDVSTQTRNGEALLFVWHCIVLDYCSYIIDSTFKNDLNMISICAAKRKPMQPSVIVVSFWVSHTDKNPRRSLHVL